MTQNPQPKTTKRDLNSRYLNSLLRNVRLKRFYGTEQGDHSCKQAYTEQEVPPKPALQNQGTPNNKNCFAGRVFFLLGGGGGSFIIRGKGLGTRSAGSPNSSYGILPLQINLSPERAALHKRDVCKRALWSLSPMPGLRGECLGFCKTWGGSKTQLPFFN